MNEDVPVDRRTWPRFGRVGLVTSGDARGQHVLLVAEVNDAWMLYLEPPWPNFRFGDSVFGFDNLIFWDSDAAIIADEWAVRWLDPGDEEAAVERAVFGVREQYEAFAARRSRRLSRGGVGGMASRRLGDLIRARRVIRASGRAARSLVGDEIVAVTYLSSSPGWPADSTLSPVVHEPDFAVFLGLRSGGEVLVCWEVIGDVGTLSVRADAAAERERARWVAVSAAEVSATAPWPELIGVPIESARMSGGRVPTGLHVGVRSGLSFEVRLGEWVDGRLSEVPNAVIVQFRR
ncbi:hypothetical protein [Cellulomonas soli]